MEKVLLALGNRNIEQEIVHNIENNFNVVGAVIRKGQILSAVKETRPDILVLRETLEGNENIRDIILKLRTEFPYVRIIFLSGHREVGDKFLSILVTYGIYDILNGGKVTLDDIIGLIYSKNDYKDVLHLQPKIVFDELDNISFEMPENITIERKNVVVNQNANDSEITEKMKSEIESELIVKVQAKLREEYNKEYQLQLQKRGQIKEQEIKTRLSKEYEQKLEEEKVKIHNTIAQQLESKVQEKVEKETQIMASKLKEKESMLRAKMEAKVATIMKEARDLKNKYESEEYEAKLRLKLEEELRAEMVNEQGKLEEERRKQLELENKKELEALKSMMIKQMEEKGNKAIKEKEVKIREEVERKKLEELEKEKKVLADQHKKEMEEFKKNLEKRKQEEIKQYEEKIQADKARLKKELSETMNKKVQEEVDRVKSKLKHEVKGKEDSLRKEMEEKITAIVNENKALKNKYETEEFENNIRSKFEKELKGKMDEERRKIEENAKKMIKQREEELAKDEQKSIARIEDNAKKALNEMKKELEVKKSKEIQSEKARLEEQSKKDIEKFKSKLEQDKMEELAKYEEKMKLHLKDVELKKQEELRQMELRKQEELRRIEAMKQEELRQMELRKQEELRRIEAMKQEELKQMELRKQEELRRMETLKQEELREVTEKLAREQEEFIKNENNFSMKNNQKIVSFLGGKNGVGVTTVAVNVAAHLAMAGSKVLYIELNPYSPSVGYWYQIERSNIGLENALKAIQDERYRDIEENVIKSKELRNGEYGKFYKSFPNGLDFLLFSQQQTLMKKERMQISSDDLKNLYFYLMQHLGYEYIVLDLRVDEEDSWVVNSLLFSTKIYQVITQDVASIAYLKYRSERIQRNNIPIDRKSAYVVNQFDGKGCRLNLRELSEFIEEDMITVPNVHQEIMNSIYDGVPAILKTRDKELKKSIEAISNDITKKQKR